MYRHGDLLLVKSSERRVGWLKADDKFDGIILRGEMTGHAHRLSDPASATAFRDGTGNVMELELHKSNSLVHEEHKEIVLPEGSYRVIRQREYEGEGWRNVAD